MKSIKKLREQYNVITEKEDTEQRKLTTLVRAGLFDAKKLPMLKRALDKNTEKMTPAEKRMLIDLLDSLMNQVISSDPVYMKVKRNVQSMDEEIIMEAPVTISDVPTIVILKRKAVRVYPGGRQVGLYYSQQLDKYVTIPFGEAGIAMSEEVVEEGKKQKKQKKSNRYEYLKSKESEDDKASRLDRTPMDKISYADRKKYMSPLKTAMRAPNLRSAIGRLIGTAILNRRGLNKIKDVKTAKAEKANANQVAANKEARAVKNKKLQMLDARQEKKQAASAVKKVKLQKIDASQARRKAAALAAKTPSKSPTAGVSKSPYTRSGAAQGTMASRFAENYRMMRGNQLYEYNAKDAANDAADVLVPGVSAYRNFKKGNYGAAALDAAIDVGAGLLAAPTLGGSFAARAGLKGAMKAGTKIAAKTGAKAAAKTGTKTFSKAAVRARALRMKLGKFGKTKLGKGLKYAGAAGVAASALGGGGGGDNQSRSSAKNPITHDRQSTLKVNTLAPEYRQTTTSVDRQDYIRNKRFMMQKESVELGGNLFEINKDISKKIVTVYNELNEENKKRMVDMLQNEETQTKIIEFVTRY